ncbi:MAG TPA: ABC transporter permease [Bacteroidales bacterium]|nr:ABC transporter permease [Bacteroidales bacterium]HQI45488.1 ABC transporter permease [Bacteroidales bacterium]
MNKILIIIHREYLSRVKKRSFIVMTILGPILLAALVIVPVFIAQMSDKEKTISVVDEKGIFYNAFPNTENIKFEYSALKIIDAKNNFDSTDYYAILYIPADFVSKPSTAALFSNKQPSITVKQYIENILKKELETMKLSSSGIDKNVLKSIETNINLATIKLKGKGLEEKGNTEISTILGMFSGILIYMFIFMFGTQVMRGVIEEKTSRIVEVIISSVKPFQLMIGKITGIAMVGLTQFLLWILLTFAIVTFFQTLMPNTFNFKNTENPIIGNSKIMNQEQMLQLNEETQYKNQGMRDIIESIGNIDFGVMIFSFLFYFLFGYLLYAALFAAVGSAVDSEADTQQFMLPITAPLIFGLVASQFVINNPEGPVAFWLSIIPLTSPIIMMVRIPFGVPIIEIVLSVTLLILGFLFCTWLAAKIYKTGILMYGKKVDYKELWKWLTYRS